MLSEEGIIKLGRKLIDLCEENKLYPKDDHLWNCAVTAGNKMVTVGTVWNRFTDFSSLSKDEVKAVLGFIKSKQGAKFLEEVNLTTAKL